MTLDSQSDTILALDFLHGVKTKAEGISFLNNVQSYACVFEIEAQITSRKHRYLVYFETCIHHCNHHPKQNIEQRTLLISKVPLTPF